MRHISFYKWLWLVALVALALLPGCRRAAEKASRKIRIEAVEAVERHALSGIDLTLRVQNGTRYKLVLREASLGLWYNGTKAGEVILRGAVEMPRRTTASIETRWKFRIEDPVALYLIVRRIRAGDVASVGVSYEAKGRGGPARMHISQPMMPLSDFLRTFGLTMDELQTYLGG